jgi:hypothetical protein
MSTNINQGNGGGEIVIVRDGEDLDAVAAMASGVASDAEQRGGGQYVPLEEVSAETFHEFAEAASAEPGADAWKRHVTVPDAEASEPPPARPPEPAAIDDPNSDEGAAHLRAARIEDARQRRARVSGALAVREDGEVSARPAEGDNLATRFKNVAAPGGRLNRRVLYVLLGAALLVIFLLLKSSSNKAKDAAAKSAADQTQSAAGQGDGPNGRRDATSMRVGAPSDGTLRSPESVMGSRGVEGRSGDATSAALGMGTSVEPPAHNLLGGPANGAQPAPLVSPVGQTTTAAAVQRGAAGRGAAGAGVAAQEPVAAPYAAAGYGTGSEGFSFKMRGVDSGQRGGAGEPVAAQASELQAAARGTERPDARARKQEAGGMRLPAGTRIPMTLLEPLQSGIETTASARVDAEVRDGKGEVMLRAGTIITIPFLAAHSNGRMMNAGEEVDVKTASGATLVLTGAVKGTDGLVGIPGRVTKSGQGNTIGRVLRGVTRIGIRQAGTVLPGGGVAGDIESETGDIMDINGAVAGRYGVRGGQREVVNIPAGVRFTFVVGK